MTKMLPVALLAGGLATRMRPLTENIPKSMIEVAGEPFVAHQLRLFKRKGIDQVVICTGYLGSMISDFVGDGARFGLSVRYSDDGETPLGTGGALNKARTQLGDEFMVVYGDSWLDTDYAAVIYAFQTSNKPALMTVFRNENTWDASNVEYDGRSILRYDKRNRTSQMQYIDWGMGIFTSRAFAKRAEGAKFDLADLYADLVESRQLAGFEVKERFYEIGSFSGLDETGALLVR